MQHLNQSFCLNYTTHVKQAKCQKPHIPYVPNGLESMLENECANFNESEGSRVCMTYRNPIRLFAIPLLGLLQLFGMGHAFADDQDAINQHVFNLEAGINLTLDNNLFRLPDSVNPTSVGLPGSQRSDTVRSEYVGLVVDQPIGLQQFHLEAVVDENSYHNYGYLNGRTTNYNGYWQLAFTPKLTGKMSSNRTQSAAGFTNYQTYNARNIITSDNTDLNLDWSPLGNWHLTSDFSDVTYVSSVNTTSVSSYDSKVTALGINYVFSSGANFGIVYNKTIGRIKSQILDITNQLDTGYQENVDKISLSWPLTGKSLINAQIGYDDRHYDHFASRNYSGSVGNLSYSQDVTSKINVTVSAGRTYNPYTENNDSYFTSDNKSLQTTCKATSKLTFKARFDSYSHDYRNPIPGVTVLIPRMDSAITHTLELDWDPLSTISVVGSVVKDQRESTVGSWNYNDTSINLSINAKF